MVKVTLPKTEYEQLQQIKKRYEAIKQLIRGDVFEKPPTRNVKEIIQEFRETGLYKEEFLRSLERGLKESSYFARRQFG